MRTFSVHSTVGVLLTAILVASCGDSSTTAPTEPGNDTGVVPDTGGDGSTDADEDGDNDVVDPTPDGGPDDDIDTGPRLAVGELCPEDNACDSSLCFRFDVNIEEGFCTEYCSEESDCPPDGFSCVFLANSGGDFARVCVPDDLCVDRDDDDYGIGPGCAGPDCDDATAAVNPAQDELCDGFDNDCDSNIDENPVDANVDCDTGFPGVCAPGRARCNGGALSCEADRSSQPEICDTLDNDCDGQADEGADGGPLFETCYGGAAATLGVGACQSGARSCTDGIVGDCVGQVLPQLEVCDGVDNDCDGTTDEGSPGANQPCDVPDAFGVCARGRTQCDAAGALICNPLATGTEEICDGQDNDCDGDVDEGDDGEALQRICYGGAEAEIGVGVCESGLQTCVGSEFGDCVGDVLPGPELCDTLDNDCDGEVDEDSASGGFVCSTGLAGACAVGTTTCSDDGTICVPNVEPSDELCDAIDNDCDGSVDENEDGERLNRTCYSGPAGTAGVGLCSGGVQTCGGEGFGLCVGEVRPSVEVCDGQDNDCDGQIDEGNPGGNVACSTGNAGICATGLTVCDEGTIDCVQSNASAAEVCDGLDNDCDGATDEDAAGAAIANSCYSGPAGTQGVGVCAAGVQACVGGSLGACAGEVRPSAEVCDGLDNDCDGQIDEGNPGSNVACSTGNAGVCAAGLTVCDEGEISCVQTTASSAETCDGRDNDCDGSTDEDASGAALSNSCYGGPAGTQGVGVCAAGVQTCAGGSLSSCVAEVRPSAEICDGLDNDCDGQIDEGNPGANVACSTGNAGVCAAGLTVCSDGEISCVQTTASSAETCDGRDNDCDGSTDEDASGAVLTEVCYDGPAGTQGVGACTAGSRTCSGGRFGSCVGQALPSLEVCDAVDNDCDGTVNDGNPGGGIACTTSASGVCAAGTTSCVSGAVTCVGTIAPGSQAEVCDTVDNDCDGTTNEGFPGLGNACSSGQGICSRPGVIVCASNTSSAPVCNAVAGPANPAETCDYVDDDCDGSVDEGFRNAGGAYNTIAHCGACGFNCDNTWPGGPALYNVATQCNAAGTQATCGFTCLAGWVNADGVADNGCEFRPEPETVYVSTFANGGRDVAGCGAYTAPCASIQGGIDLARTTAGKTRVRVSTGLYRENITLANGISVLGGHSNLNWVRNADVFGTSIRGADVAPVGVGAAVDRIVVIANGITAATEFSGFIVSGINAGGSGNSVGVYITNSNQNLVVQNNEIAAGAGGNGTTGSTGGAGGAGTNGSVGGNAVRQASSSASVPGGAGGTNTCGGVSTSGGTGGIGTNPVSATLSGAGANGSGPGTGPGGTGGTHMVQLSSGVCSISGPTDGLPGTAGSRGTDGTGGTGASVAGGSVSGGRWVAASGVNGVDGANGTGGGGGGSSGGLDDYLTNTNHFPPGGGGGGAGGCRGLSGGAGSGGGGSFAVFVHFTSAPASNAAYPVVRTNRLRRNLGGRGGDGGTGGSGGEGGLGGAGGIVPSSLPAAFCLVNGSPGGVGGRGGHGGGGGGGAGGVSYDVFVSRPGSTTPDYNTNTFEIAAATATGGSGGSGGNSSNTGIGIGGSGVTGTSGQVRIGN